jgi:hypothetical protein
MECTTLLNFLGGKPGGSICYIQSIDAPRSLEHRRILVVHCLLGHIGNGAFYKTHRYDKFLNIWPGATL